MTTIDITPTDNGPYLVDGPIRIIDADCNEYDVPEQTTIALCRCGGSSTKPFCDGTHEKTNFKAINRAADSTTHQPVAVMLSKRAPF